jgi:hypothetical protein
MSYALEPVTFYIPTMIKNNASISIVVCKNKKRDVVDDDDVIMIYKEAE